MAANMIIAEYSQILASFAPYLHPAYPQLFRDTLVNQSATLSHEESPSVAFSCGSPRYLCYLETSVANIADKILSWSSNVLFHAGFTELSGSANLLEQVNQIAIFGQFVVLMGSIVVILM